MSNYMIKPGLGNTNSYIGGAAPYVTGGILNGGLPNGGEVAIRFPSVARSFTVVNDTANQPLYVHFESRANLDVVAKHHYVVVGDKGDSWTFAVRTTGVYVSMQNAAAGSFSLVSELTSIEAKELSFPLSGSGINTD
jgi:hypothetical protein